MPMSPRPMAETARPLVPNVLVGSIGDDGAGRGRDRPPVERPGFRCARAATMRVPARYARDHAFPLGRLRAGERDHVPRRAAVAPPLSPPRSEPLAARLAGLASHAANPGPHRVEEHA